MTDQVKVIVVERNGTDLADSEELSLAAENVYLSSSSFSGIDNVKSALENVASGGASINFSYKLIDFDLTIPTKQQMVIGEGFEVADGYNLTVDGEVYVVDGDEQGSTQTFGTFSNQQDGYYESPEGFLVQWWHRSSTGTQSYTFPVAFTNVWGAACAPNKSTDGYLRVHSLSTTAITVGNSVAATEGWVWVWGEA